MIHLRVNGEERTLAAESLGELVETLSYNRRAVAAAVNGEFVPRTAYDSTELKEGDDVEVVAARQGG